MILKKVLLLLQMSNKTTLIGEKAAIDRRFWIEEEQMLPQCRYNTVVSSK